jgi:hypothetical protein
MVGLILAAGGGSGEAVAVDAIRVSVEPLVARGSGLGGRPVGSTGPGSTVAAVHHATRAGPGRAAPR